MNNQNINEKDWKLFRSRLPDWQEAYMDKLNREYVEILNGEGNASDKFWTLEKLLKEDKRAVGVSAEMRRSQMEFNLISLIHEGAICLEDLEGFSDELREKLEFYFRNRRA